MSAEAVQLDSVALAPAQIASSLCVETISDPAAFAGLRDEWNLLLEASWSDNIFLTWEWLHTWWTHLAGGRRLEILVVRGRELLAIAPFASNGTSLLGVTRLEFLGTGRVGSDYLDLIVRRGSEQAVIPALASYLLRRGAVLDMRQVRLTASAASGLARELSRAGCPVRATRTHRCPVDRELSVGLVAMGLAIKSAIAEGAAEFDLLHGAEAYKFHWTKKTRRLGRVVAFPRGPRGRLSWSAAAALDAVRRLRRTLVVGVAAGTSAARAGGGNAAPAR